MKDAACPISTRGGGGGGGTRVIWPGGWQVTDAELRRARDPLVANREASLASNATWQARLPPPY